MGAEVRKGVAESGVAPLRKETRAAMMYVVDVGGHNNVLDSNWAAKPSSGVARE